MENEIIQTSRQIADRYIAQKAIFEALVGGRSVSQLNAKEFKVEDMRSPISRIRKKITEKNLPYVLKDRWIPSGLNNKMIKEYHLETRQ